MKAVDRILGEADRRPPTNGEQTDPYLAYMYARNIVGGRWPEGEATIIQHPEVAYDYARYILKERWPIFEPVIGKDPLWSFYYAKDVIKGRFIAAEETLAHSQSDAKKWYLEVFPEAKEDWIINGWIDWLDT
jgi:hypothetical protein